MRRAILAVLLALAGCGSSPSADEAGETATTLVTTVQPVRGALPTRIEAYGQAAPAANGVVTLSVPQPGQVVAVPVVAGARVSAGQPIVVFAVAPSARSTYVQAETAVKAARQARATTAQLLSQQLATRDQLAQADKAVTDAEVALAALAKEGAGAATQTLRAPAAGVVNTVSVAPGDRTQPGQALASIARAGSVIVSVGVDPSRRAEVRVGAAVELRRLDDETSPPVAGRVVRVDAALNQRTHLVDVDIAYPAGALLTGEALRAAIVTGTATGWIVPHAAVAVGDADRAQLFQIAGGKARAVPVTILSTADGRDCVAGPLRPGAPVVVDGAYQLADGDAVRTRQAR